jgi:hypothetical protein
VTGLLDVPVETRWTQPLVEERCRAVRGSLRARGETDTELDAYAPGGAQNQVADPLGAALHWYALLRGRLAFLEWKQNEERAHGEAALAAALTNAPAPVTLADGVARAVYPKGYHALKWCDAIDRALQDVTARALDLADEPEVRTLAPLTESLTVRLWAWTLTHPDPDVPFDEGQPAEPPAWTRALTPEDLVALLRAHMQVNRTRIQQIAALFPAEREAQSRLSLAGFLGTIAQELGHRPTDVLRRWSLGEAFAQAVVAAESAREARARAEDEAASRRKT